MYKIAVCDDDKIFLKQLEKKLDVYKKDCEFIFYTNPLILKKEIKEYDAVFIDYDMPQENAYNFFESIKDVSIERVVITNYDAVVYKGFQYGFFWFIRKEFIDEELPEMMKNLLARLKDANSRLIVHTANRDLSLPLDEIRYIETQKNYIIVHGKEEYKVRNSFLDIQKSITSDMFLVPVYGVIVNIRYIKFINYTTYTIIMLDGKTLNISRSKKKEVLEKYRAFLTQ